MTSEWHAIRERVQDGRVAREELDGEESGSTPGSNVAEASFEHSAVAQSANMGL